MAKPLGEKHRVCATYESWAALTPPSARGTGVTAALAVTCAVTVSTVTVAVTGSAVTVAVTGSAVTVAVTISIAVITVGYRHRYYRCR